MLKNLIQEIRSYPGITRKRNIYRLTSQLSATCGFGSTVIGFGDDAAAIYHNGEYLLLAADGIWTGLLEANPYGAGKASVMASVNDIYAMGGRPLAMVNVVGIPDVSYYDEIVRGIRKGCEKFRVPMVGGHLHPDTREVSLSVAILGVAKKLLRSDAARPGHDLIFAVDLDGRGYQCKPVLSWDTNSGKTAEQVISRLEVLPSIAEKGLCSVCKDVSNGGLLGTIALMLESSRVGAVVDIDKIPCPAQYCLNDWLRAFLSYGFILCVDRHMRTEVVRAFSDRGITALCIGTITTDRTFYIRRGEEQDLLFDLSQEHITGIMQVQAAQAGT